MLPNNFYFQRSAIQNNDRILPQTAGHVTGSSAPNIIDARYSGRERRARLGRYCRIAHLIPGTAGLRCFFDLHAGRGLPCRDNSHWRDFIHLLSTGLKPIRSTTGHG